MLTQLAERHSSILCSNCDCLLEAALKASKAYHELLGALEAADIRHNSELALHLQAGEAKSASDRNDAITALRDHERSHAGVGHGKQILSVKDDCTPL
jgi:hypothetical protein